MSDTPQKKMDAAQVATVIEGHAAEYRETATVMANAKAEALEWAAKLVRDNLTA